LKTEQAKKQAEQEQQEELTATTSDKSIHLRVGTKMVTQQKRPGINTQP
jgi:hypothetical protein